MIDEVILGEWYHSIRVYIDLLVDIMTGQDMYITQSRRYNPSIVSFIAGQLTTV